MEKYMTQEREEYITKLKDQIKAINDILKMDLGTVISTELRKQLRALKYEAEIVLHKLVNNEFEIAIVGLEKAGKSTFANALMESNLLPAKDLRCTFTSTQIEYSGDDKDDNATVSFYSTEEFNNDFKDKLCKLGFPNYEQYSFDIIDEEKYVSIYEREVSDDKKIIYGDSINEDILAIIRNANSLSSLLDRPSISFGADAVNSGEVGEYITDEAKARAVKQVVIRSKKLKEMKNAIIFDVPGFNSPTELHKIQTLERMKSADAIIVVANGISPSLTAESLKILRESDDEGNPLRDKLFVFANKIELARDISKNISDTFNEWINKGFISQANKHRIIFGSALAHLQAANLDKGDHRTLRSFEERKSEMPNGDGIDVMRKILAEYNEKERFEVIKRRINRIKADIPKAFRDIISGNEELATSRSYSQEQVDKINNLIYEMTDSDGELVKKLNALKDNIKTDMFKEEPLSKQLTQYIRDNVTIEKYSVSDEEIDIEKKNTKFISEHEEAKKIDENIREKKFDEMYEDFSQNVFNIADTHRMEYSSKILNIIMDSMGVDTNSPYRDELVEALKKEIGEIRGDMISNDHSNELYYQSLIERFSRYIYQILILSRYDEERLGVFYDDIDNLYSLSVFYRKPDCEDDLAYINIAPKDQPLCMMLLFHHYLNAADNIHSIIDNIGRKLGLSEIPKEICNIVEKVFFATSGDVGKIIGIITKEAEKIVDKTDDFKINIVRNILSEVVKSEDPCSIADKEAFTQYYKQYHNSIKTGKLYSIDDFRKDFNTDIQILQDVLINAFVRAIRMEKPFVAREYKSIEDIILYIEKNEKFRSFISANFYKIKYEENQLLDKKHREQEQNAAIVKTIHSIIDSLN